MNKNNYIIAVDLGSASVKAAAGSREPDGRLNVLEVVSKPMEGMIRGEVVNIEQVTKAIREAVSDLEEKLDIKVTEAYTGASGQDIKCAENTYFVYVTGEDGEIRETDVAKLHESMDNLQPPDGVAILDRIPQKYLIDNHEETLHPVGRFGHQLQATFNFVLGNKSTLDRMAKAFKRLEIRQLETYTNAQASAAAVLTEDEKELGAAVIDIGAGCSDICIWQDNKLRHVGVIPIGSAAINSDIKAIAIPERSIEKLKVTHGYAVANKIPEEKKTQSIKIKGRTQRETKEVSFYNLAQIIEARVLDIIEHAMEEIKESGYGDKLGAGIVLTGGGAMLKDIDALFREKTGMDVRIGGTERNAVSRESYEFADDPHFSTTLGILLLGMRGSDIEPLGEPVNKRRKPVEEEKEEKGPKRYEIDYDDEAGDRDRYSSGKREPVRERDADHGKNQRGGKEEKRTESKKEEKTVKPKEPKQKKEKGDKKGIFGGFKKFFDDVFEVVDDDVIE